MPRVVAYYNLNALKSRLIDQQWSICAVEGKSGRGAKLDAVKSLILKNCTFTVQPAAQRKIFNGAGKSVHAWVIGERVENIPVEKLAIPITYNPRKSAKETFRRRDNGAAVTFAEYVEFTANGKCIAYGRVE